jgi:alpha-mannosidase
MRIRILTCVVFLCSLAAFGQNSTPDLTRQPALYVVPYAHLDTQWRWDYKKTPVIAYNPLEGTREAFVD